MASSYVLRETHIMAKLRTHYVVQYNDSWIENNTLFIQMEYCFENLKNVLAIKTLVFKRNDNQAMNSIEYFISCEIFRQITEALHYMHSLTPKLLHRDLKPSNILIGMSGNKRICKIADFGLSKFIEEYSASHTKNIGTHGYSAPEVLNGKRYDIKADIYSLGMIGLEIFDTSNNEPKKGYTLGKIFTTKIHQKIDDWDRFISDKLIIASRRYRVSSQEVLTQFRKFRINKKSIRENEIEFYEKKFEENNSQYFLDIISD